MTHFFRFVLLFACWMWMTFRLHLAVDFTNLGVLLWLNCLNKMLRSACGKKWKNNLKTFIEHSHFKSKKIHCVWCFLTNGSLSKSILWNHPAPQKKKIQMNPYVILFDYLLTAYRIWVGCLVVWKGSWKLHGNGRIGKLFTPWSSKMDVISHYVFNIVSKYFRQLSFYKLLSSKSYTWVLVCYRC